MKKVKDGHLQLELPEVIRANQLVREKIDPDGFSSWYKELSLPEQLALVGSVIFFADQAGITDDVWNEAIVNTGLTDDNSLLIKLNSLIRKPLMDFDSFDNWFSKLSETDQLTVFSFIVYLFGLAEGRNYRSEQKEWCNHWWHRDLLDERVVHDILNDPKFYMTSMQDDERIKKKTWRSRLFGK